MTTMSHGARELMLYAENDGLLHKQMEVPIQTSLATKKARGEYDHDLAVKAWMSWANEAAKRYTKEHGSRGDDWFKLFPVADREQAAKAAAQSFEAEHALGNYDYLLPKKYQQKAQAKKSSKARGR